MEATEVMDFSFSKADKEKLVSPKKTKKKTKKKINDFKDYIVSYTSEVD